MSKVYSYVLPRRPQTDVPRSGTVDGRTAKEAKAKIVRAAGWGHCFWTMVHTRVRLVR